MGSWGWAALSLGFGVTVGFSEIISRYRDEPLRATVNRFGLGYLALNGLLSAGAYGLLRRYSTGLLPGIADDPFLAAVIGGFGAMAVLRSNLFLYRAEDGSEYPIGPAIVMETFLRMLDRKIDRHRASRRQERVFEAMRDIADFDAVANYLEASLLSFQNLGEQEKAAITDVIQEYRQQTDWPPALRTMAVGFAFLTIAGEENFDQVIANVRAYLETLKREPPPTP
jgi:hypothetical protein